MKKFIVIAAVAAMAFSLAACETNSTGQPSAEATTVQTEKTGLANPWMKAETPEDAAKGAGTGSFVVPEAETETSGGPIHWAMFQYMEGIAEADGSIGTADLTVRKGRIKGSEDISGDYTEYTSKWVQKVGDCQVTCFGNEDGKMMKAVWTKDGFSYSIMIRGQGDYSDTYGVDAEAVEALVSGIR